MKRILVLCFVLILLVSCLAGCTRGDRYRNYEKFHSDTRPAKTEPSTTAPPTTEPPTTVPPTEPPTTEPPTTVPPTEPAPEVPFLQKIYPGQSVYSGPGYHYPFSQTIHEEGTFTIVEVEYDQSGHLWGRLKSGVGWVDLSDLVPETSYYNHSSNHEAINPGY